VKQEQFLKVVSRDEAERLFREAVDFAPLPAETCSLRDALGRVLAADVVSPVDVPGFTRANMDGFAVRAADTFGATEEEPRTLALHDEVIATGVVPTRAVEPGERPFLLLDQLRKTVAFGCDIHGVHEAADQDLVALERHGHGRGRPLSVQQLDRSGRAEGLDHAADVREQVPDRRRHVEADLLLRGHLEQRAEAAHRPDQGLGAAESVARDMATLLGHDDAWVAAEVERYRAIVSGSRRGAQEVGAAGAEAAA